MKLQLTTSAVLILVLSKYSLSAEVTKLEEITVNENYSNNASTSYTVKATNSATKLDLSLKETPQTVVVITQKQIEDQNLEDINDVLGQVPGLTYRQMGNRASGNTTWFARGMRVDSYQLNGMPTSKYAFGGTEYIGLGSTDVYERVEVVKGSTGLTNGTGNPSASINYVTKKPNRDFQGNAKISYGSWDTYKGMIDISGGLNEDKSIRGRLVASYKDGEGQQDRYKEDDTNLYGILEFDLSDNTLLTTSIQHQKLNTTAGTVHGVNRLSHDGKITHVSRSFNSAPDWAYGDVEKTTISLGLEHYFNDDWKAVANYSFTKAKTDRIYGMATPVFNYTAGTVTNIGGSNVTLGENTLSGMTGRATVEPDVHNIDIYSTGNIKVFDREHKLSFGINGYKVTANDPSYGQAASVASNHWDYNIPLAGYTGNSVSKPVLSEKGRNKLDEQQIGGFAAINFELADPLHFIAGARVTKFERTNNKGTAKEQEQKHNAEVIPYFGLVYDINENFSTYASYTSIFNPVTSQNASGDYLDPEKGNTVEFGLKSDFYDGKLNISVAYFMTKEENKAIVDTYYSGILNENGNTIYKSVDGAKIRGWDLIIGGEVLPNWNISGGYTYTNAEDKDGNDLETTVPKQMLKIFTSYKYNQFTVGAGVNWQSKTWIYSDKQTALQNSTYKSSSYAVVNAMLKYDVNKNLDVIFNANNIFDEKYTYYPTQWGYGEERNYTLALNYKF